MIFSVIRHIYLDCVPDGKAQAAGDEQDGTTGMVMPKCAAAPLLGVVPDYVDGPKV